MVARSCNPPGWERKKNPKLEVTADYRERPCPKIKTLVLERWPNQIDLTGPYIHPPTILGKGILLLSSFPRVILLLNLTEKSLREDYKRRQQFLV